jgi:hypothetical protein
MAIVLADAISLNAQAKDTWFRYSVNFTIGGTTEGYLAIVNPDRGTGTGFDLALPQVFTDVGLLPSAPS